MTRKPILFVISAQRLFKVALCSIGEEIQFTVYLVYSVMKTQRVCSFSVIKMPSLKLHSAPLIMTFLDFFLDDFSK